MGLTAPINYSVPILMLLCPSAITIIALSLCDKLFGGRKSVYVCVTAGALSAAVFDFLKTPPAGVQSALPLKKAAALAERVFPLFSPGLGWLVPSLIGLVIGLLWKKESSQ